MVLGDLKPGTLSAELKEALGMSSGDEPPYYPNMREHGYPPGYMGRRPKPLERKWAVKAPKLILLNKEDNPESASDLVEDEIVQLVEYPGLSRRGHDQPLWPESRKRKRDHTQATNETDMDMSDDDVVLARTSTPTLPFPPRFHHAVPFYPVPAFHQHYYPHAAYLTYHPGYGRSILSNSPYALMKTNASHPTLTHFHSHTIPPQQLPPGVPSVSTTEEKQARILAQWQAMHPSK